MLSATVLELPIHHSFQHPPARPHPPTQMIKEALQRAKRVAETVYSVVGIVEEFNITLAVMEAYLPGGHHDITNPACIYNQLLL